MHSGRRMRRKVGGETRGLAPATSFFFQLRLTLLSGLL